MLPSRDVIRGEGARCPPRRQERQEERLSVSHTLQGMEEHVSLDVVSLDISCYYALNPPSIPKFSLANTHLR